MIQTLPIKKVITENESVSGDPEETDATAKFEIPATGCASSKIPKFISKSKLKFSIKTGQNDQK